MKILKQFFSFKREIKEIKEIKDRSSKLKESTNIIKEKSKEKIKQYKTLFNKKDIYFILLGFLYAIIINIFTIKNNYKFLFYVPLIIYPFIVKKIKKLNNQDTSFILVICLKILLGVFSTNFIIEIIFKILK